MKLAVYGEALKLGLADLYNYRADTWFQTISKIISLTSLAILWWWLLKDGPRNVMVETAGYLFIANGIREVIDAFYMKYAGKMMDEIKDGSISSGLIRPVVPYKLSYFVFCGSRGVNFIFGAILILIGIVISPPNANINYLLFVGLIILGNLISYYLNLLTGFMAFWVIEGANIRGLIIHTARVLSGSMIPLNYFPGMLRVVALASPFPVLAYLPTRVLQRGIGGYEWSIVAALGWLLVMIFLEKRLWVLGLKRYEAVGL